MVMTGPADVPKVSSMHNFIPRADPGFKIDRGQDSPPPAGAGARKGTLSPPMALIGGGMDVTAVQDAYAAYSGNYVSTTAYTTADLPPAPTGPAPMAPSATEQSLLGPPPSGAPPPLPAASRLGLGATGERRGTDHSGRLDSEDESSSHAPAISPYAYKTVEYHPRPQAATGDDSDSSDGGVAKRGGELATKADGGKKGGKKSGKNKTKSKTSSTTGPRRQSNELTDGAKFYFYRGGPGGGTGGENKAAAEPGSFVIPDDDDDDEDDMLRGKAAPVGNRPGPSLSKASLTSGLSQNSFLATEVSDSSDEDRDDDKDNDSGDDSDDEDDDGDGDDRGGKAEVGSDDEPSYRRPPAGDGKVLLSTPEGVQRLLGTPDIQGHMLQRVGKNKWVKRYFVRRRNLLVTFPNVRASKPVGMTVLDGVAVEASAVAVKDHSLTITQRRTGTVEIAAGSRTAAEQWLTDLRRGAKEGPQVSMGGYMTKQGGSVKNWKRRLFVLCGDTLFYYKPNDPFRLQGFILVQGSTIARAEVATKKPYSFSIAHSNRRTYYMYADDEEAMLKWMNCIQDATKFKFNPGKN